METNAYTELFEEHRSTAIPALWPWQTEVLAGYAGIEGDAAVELPTGAGKTLIGLLAGECHRKREKRRVAYLAGNKQLAQQVERQARDLDLPIVRFEGPKDSWDQRAVRQYNFGQAIGVMNYWNYFNASPGVEPADKLILDDVHLLEGPLRDMFTVTVTRSDPLLQPLLRLIVERYPYYIRADDLLNGVEITKPPEMLAFPDSAGLADEARDLLDAGLREGSSDWWAWQNVREQLAVCCWLVSSGAVTFTPYIPPTQTINHFRDPSSRLYLSATIGTVDDLQRRLGAPPLAMLGAAVQPMQGDRLVVVRDDPDVAGEVELVDELRPILEDQRKALWLCARKDTAANVAMALTMSELDGPVRVLEADNAADEPFAGEDSGHLVAAGRYDGMDFPGDACRVEVIPEVPIATSDLEEFVSAFLRDAPFAQARFGQRVAQALGRCNRNEDDRAVYLLTDSEFLGRFSQQQVLDALPGHVRDDVYSAIDRVDEGFEAALAEAKRFLDGDSVERVQLPDRAEDPDLPATAPEEVEGILALWLGDYRGAADYFDKVAERVSAFGEYRGFWLAMRALALRCAAHYGDGAAGSQAHQALEAAATAGGRNMFFSRLRLSGARTEDQNQVPAGDGHNDLFGAWDRLMDRYGTAGPRLDRWAGRLLSELRSDDHDAVARAIAEVGSKLLGFSADAPKATSGEEDASWGLPCPRRVMTFEVKLAPQVASIVNDDVEQAEGATKAAETQRGYEARGILITPHGKIEKTAVARLERVRLLTVETFAGQVEKLLDALRDYRRQWGVAAPAREQARASVSGRLPVVDWLWRGSLHSADWIDQGTLDDAWHGRLP